MSTLSALSQSLTLTPSHFGCKPQVAHQCDKRLPPKGSILLELFRQCDYHDHQLPPSQPAPLSNSSSTVHEIVQIISRALLSSIILARTAVDERVRWFAPRTAVPALLCLPSPFPLPSAGSSSSSIAIIIRSEHQQPGKQADLLTGWLAVRWSSPLPILSTPVLVDATDW